MFAAELAIFALLLSSEESLLSAFAAERPCCSKPLIMYLLWIVMSVLHLSPSLASFTATIPNIVASVLAIAGMLLLGSLSVTLSHCILLHCPDLIFLKMI
jgi:hypothetical protein